MAESATITPSELNRRVQHYLEGAPDLQGVYLEAELANFKKHGVWFEEAQTVILNPSSLVAVNDHSSGDRMEYLGYSVDSKLLYVVTVEKSDDDTIEDMAAVVSGQAPEVQTSPNYAGQAAGTPVTNKAKLTYVGLPGEMVAGAK